MRRAFVMGSNGPNGASQLKYALEDVKRVSNSLSDPRCGFEVENPKPDSDIWSIYKQLANASESCTKDDTFVCYFSGHGRLKSGSLFLLWDNSNADKLNTTALSIARIMESLSHCEAQSKLLILDCCHAGAVVSMPKSGDEAATNEIIIKPDNYLIFIASTRSEQTREFEELKGSFLTANICDAIGEKLDEADLDKDGRISINDLKNWIEQRFKQYNEKLPEEERVPLPYLYGQHKGEIFLTLPSSNENLDESIALENGEILPYQALNAFSKNTAKFFFGRDRIVEDLEKALENSNFALLVGASGSGKSSVVKAGLTPRLEQAGWLVVEPIVPWVEPVSYLKYEITQKLFTERDIIQKVHELIDADGLTSITKHIPGEKPILVIVDQFEEVFTVCSQQSEQRRFIELVTQVANISTSRLKIVATIRADFIEDCLKHPSLTHLIQNQSVFIPELEGEDLKQVITKPSEQLKYSFDEGLAESIIEQIGQEKNFLPLLQFALTELWKERDRKAQKLTATQYLKQGGILGVLNRRAEDIYQSFDKQEQAWVKRIFLKLIRTGIGEKDTRQRQPKQKLLSIAKDRPEEQKAIQIVLDKLVKERLLVAGRDIENKAWIDLAHEALMDGWEQFSLWRKENRELRRLHDRVEDAYREWIKFQKDRRFLMMGGLLVQTEEKYSELELELSPETKEFYELSKSAEDKTNDFLLPEAGRQNNDHQLELQKYQTEIHKHKLEVQKYKSQVELKDAQLEWRDQQEKYLKEILKNLSEKESTIIVNEVSSKSIKNTPAADGRESLTYNFEGANISGGIVMNNYAPENKQSLAEAAAEIQQLLEQLDKSYSTDKTAEEMTTAEKMTVAAEAIERIEDDPTLKHRLIKALRAGSTDALRELLNHPASSFLIGAMRGWQDEEDIQ